MCCGGEIREDVGAEMRAARSGGGGVMAKVYATQDGAELTITGYGVASRLPIKDKDGKVTGWKDTPVEVPEEAVEGLVEEVEVDRINPDWHDGVDEKVTPRVVKVKVPTGLRIERAGKAAAPKATGKAAKEKD
jgi:hypothetical protein